MTMLLGVQDVLEKGLAMVGYTVTAQQSMSRESCDTKFRKHFGSSPLVLGDMWYELTSTDIPLAALNDNEKNMKGFESFMRAHYFLWTYPRNAEQFARVFGKHERKVQGKPLWGWIGKIAALREKKIKWPSHHGADPDVIYFSVDGTDCKCDEPHNHPRYPIDTKMRSEKFNKAGWKYLVAMTVHKSQIVAVHGPFKAGSNELSLFREHIKDHLRSVPGATMSADLGFRTSEEDEVDPPMFSYPNSMDPENVRTYKSRVRCRHESLFGRMKNFKVLANTFKHTKEKHSLAFNAVAVTLQYQMDNGSPLYTV